MGQVIVITSGKGGVGKTTTSANLGAGLAIKGKKVVLIDGDTGLRNLDLVMGLENRIVYDLVDVIEGRCRLNQAIIKDKRYPDLHLLPTAQLRDKNSITPEQMVGIVNLLREEFDFIIIDCPAGIEQGFKNAIAAADRAIVVTTPEVPAVRDADRIVGLLNAAEITNSMLLLNRIKAKMTKSNDMLSLDDVTEILAIDVIGIVPDDEDIVVSTNKGEPCVADEKSFAGQGFRDIVRRLLGETVPLMNLDVNKGFFQRLFKRF